MIPFCRGKKATIERTNSDRYLFKNADNENPPKSGPRGGKGFGAAPSDGVRDLTPAGLRAMIVVSCTSRPTESHSAVTRNGLAAASVATVPDPLP